MQVHAYTRNLSKLFILQLCLVSFGYSQFANYDSIPSFDSQLLRLNVPEAFQKSSLKMEVYSDSSWQIYRGDQALNFSDAMKLLSQSKMIVDYTDHQEKEAQYIKDYRSHRVFSIVTSVGGASYLVFAWHKGWVYQIPGFAALAISGVRYWESRKLETLALRERYYQQSIASPALMRQLIDDYNFRLYQYLSQAGIQFSDT